MKTLEKHLMHFYHNMADYRDRHVFQALHHHSEINSTNWIYSLKFISDYVRMQIINIFRMGSNINIAIHKFIEVSQKVLQVPVSINKKNMKKNRAFPPTNLHDDFPALFSPLPNIPIYIPEYTVAWKYIYNSRRYIIVSALFFVTIHW